MSYNTILSNANKLKKNSLYKSTIIDSTQELLYRINSDILSAHDAGLSIIECKLPINFKQIDNNITNKELQISIYHNIVSELERMGYETRIKFLRDHTMIKISWSVKASESDLTNMQNKLLDISY